MGSEEWMEPTESWAVGLEEDASLQADASPRRRRRGPQVGEWYGTLAMVGALVGLFVAGLLVALNQAFPDGGSGGLNPGLLTGISIAIIVGASLLGALTAGVPPLIAWVWRRPRGWKAQPSEDAEPPIGEWYVTMAMVGALVGLFVAGLLVALNQAFPDGGSGGLNPGLLTGISIAIIVGASLLGALMAGVPPLTGWVWRRVRGRKPQYPEEAVPPASEVHEGLGDR